MSPPQRSGTSADLADELWSWREWWERHSTYGGAEPASAQARADWNERGLALAHRLAQQTGAEVVYRWPYGPAGGDPDCPHCGPAVRAGS